MNRKEILERVDFSLTLSEWATTQPGYKPPVTEADVQELMAKLKEAGLFKKPDPEHAAIPAHVLKTAILKSVIKYHVIAIVAPPKSIQEAEQQLIHEGLLSPKTAGETKPLEVTPAGRRSLQSQLQNSGVSEWVDRILNQAYHPD